MVAISAIIGPAFQALSKVKKGAWTAMKGAMGSVKSAAGPMSSIMNSLKILQPIMKIISALFMVLGATVLKTVLPALQPLLNMLASPVMLGIMEDLGTIIGIALIPVFQILTATLEVVAPIIKSITGFFIENKDAMNLLILAMFPILGVLKLLTENWTAIWGVLKNVGTFIKNVFLGAWNLLINSLKFVANGFIWFINAIIGGINLLMNFLTAGLWGDIPSIPLLHSGTPYVPRTQAYILEQGEGVISRRDNRGRGEIHIHIDLRNAVVDNVDNLSQKIAEQVLIQIG